MLLQYVGCTIGLIIVAYFLGNINFSILLSKLKHSDVRSKGSGNPGSMNMLRSFGVKLGVLTLMLDAIKGALPALLGWWLLGNGVSEMFVFGADKTGLFIGGISVVIGHIFPLLYKFKGGKGVASTIGVCLVVDPILTLVSFVLGVVYILTVKIGAVTSFIIICIPLIYNSVIYFTTGYLACGIMAIALMLMVIVAHYQNIGRIFKGEEKQIILFGKNKSSKKIQEESK